MTTAFRNARKFNWLRSELDKHIHTRARVCAPIIRLTVNNDNNNNILRVAADSGLGVDSARRQERVFPCQYQISFFLALSSTYLSHSSPLVSRRRRSAKTNRLSDTSQVRYTCRPFAGILAYGRRENIPVEISQTSQIQASLIFTSAFCFFRRFSAILPFDSIELMCSKYVSLQTIITRKSVEKFTTRARPFQRCSTSEIDSAFRIRTIFKRFTNKRRCRTIKTKFYV